MTTVGLSLEEGFKLISKEIDRVNTANGFEPPTWDNLPVKLMLVITELEEGRESVVLTSPQDTLEVEMADVCIRLLSILHTLTGGSWVWQEPITEYRRGVHNHYCQEVWPVVRWCCRAVEDWRRDLRDDAITAVAYALRDTINASVKMGISKRELLSVIEWKVEKNSKRGHLHGKARTDG